MDVTIAYAEQLSHIARQVCDKADSWRVEFDEVLQEARLGAWDAYERCQRTGLAGVDERRYVLGAARRAAERYLKRMGKDPLFNAENFGLVPNGESGVP